MGEGRRAVAIGGGTGLPAVLQALLGLGFETAAVVSMADDGGSSGLLREQLGMLPPGDIRNCLVAMAAEEDGLEARLLQYRFPHGEGLAGHALGNLILAALTDLQGSFAEAIETVEGYLTVRGKVLPSTLVDVRLTGVDRAGLALTGQAKLAVSSRPLAHVRLDPNEPAPYGPALEAIRRADVIVIGPGSLYTSIIPNFLVDGLAKAVRDSAALRVYVCNVANMRGETHGLDAADHVIALEEHGLAGAIDVAIVHDPSVSVAQVCDDDIVVEPVASGPDIRARIEALGIRVVGTGLADASNPARHSRPALKDVLEGVVS
ncbi:MAG: YvcK family protein [Coriobacteriia bacterium]|nr:YvcK family protein [Coriobacteriia bacterium]